MLYGSSAPLLDRAGVQGEASSADGRSPVTIGASACRSGLRLGWAETPLDDWIFAPDHAIPLLENHFGVLSLEGFGLAGKRAAASAAGAILYYIRSTQRGTLDHVDRIGFYEAAKLPGARRGDGAQPGIDRTAFAGTDAGSDSVSLPWMPR